RSSSVVGKYNSLLTLLLRLSFRVDLPTRNLLFPKSRAVAGLFTWIFGRVPPRIGFSNQNSLSILRLKVAPHAEPEQPYNFLSAGHHRPKLLTFSCNVPVLQQFFDLLRLFAMCGPEALTGSPVPDDQSALSERRTD